MAFTCGFFNSQNGDRKYNAEQMASIFDGLIKDGVYDTVGEIFAVTPGTGMQVLVGSGRAWFDHTWNNNDASYPLAITAADVSLPRYDAVVLETNHSDTVRTNRLRVVTGTPASNPAKPTMASSANVKQHPLAYIKVTAGAKAITQSMIQVVVGTSECPFVTGIIDTAEIDALFQQWNGEFNEWFENLKAQLSDNVVANLQGQIDQKVAKADVATTADIEAGTSTTKWVTPKGLKEAGIDDYQVGDVLCTARTDLGEKWALCNGGTLSKIEYPKMIPLLPDFSSPWNKTDILTTTSSSNTANFIYGIAYGNGYYVAVGCNQLYNAIISYATNLTGPWTTRTLWTNSSGASINNIIFRNNQFICCGANYNNGRNACIAYTSDPSTNWTINTIYSGSSNAAVFDFKFLNGYYTVYGFINNPQTGNRYIDLIAYTNDITGSWTTININEYGSTLGGRCEYINGYYVLNGGLYEQVNYNTVNQYACFWYSTSLSGPWNEVRLEKQSGTPNEIADMVYFNGKYIAISYNGKLFHSDQINGSWVYGTSISMSEITDLIVYGNYIHTCGIKNSRLYRSFIDSPTGIWNDIDMKFSRDGYNRGRLNHAEYGWTISGRINNLGSIIYSDPDNLVLPTITSDKTYNYIKVK